MGHIKKFTAVLIAVFMLIPAFAGNTVTDAYAGITAETEQHKLKKLSAITTIPNVSSGSAISAGQEETAGDFTFTKANMTYSADDKQVHLQVSWDPIEDAKGGYRITEYIMGSDTTYFWWTEAGVYNTAASSINLAVPESSSTAPAVKLEITAKNYDGADMLTEDSGEFRDYYGNLIVSASHFYVAPITYSSSLINKAKNNMKWMKPYLEQFRQENYSKMTGQQKKNLIKKFSNVVAKKYYGVKPPCILFKALGQGTGGSTDSTNTTEYNVELLADDADGSTAAEIVIHEMRHVWQLNQQAKKTKTGKKFLKAWRAYQKKKDITYQDYFNLMHEKDARTAEQSFMLECYKQGIFTPRLLGKKYL